MKSKPFFLPVLLLAYTMQGQLAITPGTQFSIESNMRLTLHNTDLINNGNISTGNSVISFAGSISSTISGSEPVQFYELEINKANNAAVLLQQAIDVRNRIFFSSGLLDLNGFNADLGTTSRIENEDESRHVTGTNGGQIILRTVLNAPSFVNPGNLGAVISSSKNLGNVILKRGHQSQSGSGLAGSILRYYEIVPENNSNLDASLKINYFNGELNGLDENSVVFFKSDDGIDWLNQGLTTRSPNFATKSNINSFSKWTLAADNNLLSVQFIVFNTECQGNKLLLSWKTAQEHNSERFDVERTIDGIQWFVIGSVSAAGNSRTEKLYSFDDNSALQNGQYRIAAHSLDGKVQYSNTLQTFCSTVDAFKLWPNPTHDIIFIKIVSSNDSPVVIHVFDSKGALVKIQKNFVLQGNNLLSLDIASLANEAYYLSIDWSNGHIKKAVQVVKQ